jgi:acetolactate synthase-1/2/3 large subunit
MLRSTRLLRSLPSTSLAPIRQKSTSARSDLHTSAAASSSREGISIDAKARVREHVRRIQSSATQGAAPVVRPNPSPTFQVPPQAQIKESPQYIDPLQCDPQVRNGLDYS